MGSVNLLKHQIDERGHDDETKAEAVYSRVTRFRESDGICKDKSGHTARYLMVGTSVATSWSFLK